jgi:Flp pilus assembly protein TadD
LSRLTKLLEQQEDSDKLNKYSERLFKIRPNTESAHYIIENLLAKKEFSKAIEFIEKASEMLPNEDLLYSISRISNYIYLDSSLYSEQFIPELIRIINKKFYFEWRLTMTGAYLADKINDMKSRDQLFTRSINLGDTIPDIPFQIGLFYLLKRENELALDIFRAHKDNYPDDYRFYMYEGVILSSMDSLQAALIPLRRAKALNDKNVDLWTELALVYDRLGMSDSSDIAYERVLELEPFNALANNNYAYSLVVRGEELDRALRMSKTALEANSSNAAYLDTYGWIQFKIGNYDTALEYILRAVNLDGKSAEVFEHLGDIYIKLSDKSKALEAYKKALEIEPQRESVKKKLQSVK